MDSKVQIAIISAVIVIAALVIVVIAVPDFSKFIITPGQISVERQDNVKQSPNARFAISPTVGPYTINEVISFSATGSRDPDGNIVKYEWNFGDGDRSGEPSPTHAYTRTGTFTVTLKVVDNDELADSFERFLTIEEAPPEPPQPSDLEPDLRIVSFRPVQAVVSELQPPECIGCPPPEPCGLNHPPCDYGFVTGEIRNVGDGNANNCKIIVREDFEVDSGWAVLNTETFFRTSEEELQGIDANGVKSFKVKFEIPYPGNYEFSGKVECSNALSSEWADGETFHFALG